MKQRVLLIRHCRATGQAPGAPLTPEGLDAAENLAGRLASLGADAAYASPYRRAIQTIASFAAARGLHLETDVRLVERRLTVEDDGAWLEHLRRSFADDHYRAPGGETLHEARARGLAALAAISARGHDRPAVATHGNLLSSLLRCADPSFGFEAWRALGNPDVFDVSLDKGRPAAFRRIA